MATNTVNYNPHVIETGTEGIWTYRKWSDGTAECWGTDSSSFTAWVSWNGVYETDKGIQAIFPSGLFIEAPKAQYNLKVHGMSTWAEMPITTITKDKTDELFALRPNALSGGSTLYLTVYAIGKWK